MITALTFHVAGARLGLPAAQVREVVPMVKLVAAPEMPALLRGFLNLEGTFIPVIRLEHLLQLDMKGQTWMPERDLNAKIVLAEEGDTTVAWMVDAGLDLLTCPVADIVKLPAGHVLNSCADRVIPRQPPEPSIVLLAAGRILLRKEKAMLELLTQRAQTRTAEASVMVDPARAGAP